MKIPTNYSINVTTMPFSNGVITQEVNDVIGRLTRYICDTQDQQIRQALMQLGWLPPEEGVKLHKQLVIAESWIGPYNKFLYEQQCEEEI